MDLNPTDMNTAPQEVEEQKTITDAATEQTAETETTETEVPTEETTTEESVTPEEKATEEKDVTPEEPQETPTAEDGEEEEEESEEEESEEGDEQAKAPHADLSKLSGDELYEAINAMVEEGTIPSQRDMRRLERQMMPKGSVTTKPADEESAETESTEATPEDESVVRFINLKTRVQKLRSDQREQERTEREANLAAKRQLVERLRDLLSPTNTMNPITLRNEFFNIRHSWSEVGRVPDNDRNALMDEYSGLLDRFYEEKEVGEGERIQDYADNRATKEAIIAKAKALADDKDAVKAFRKMKGLLDEWKEVGPVAPEFKDSLWKDFKDAQQVVYKRHDDHFKAIHEDEKANYEKKKELVDNLEKMLVTLPDSRQGWRRYENELRKIHTQWMSIGRVPKDLFIDLRSRYDVVRDEFFMRRKAFLKDLSAEISPKLERLRELVDEAEALQDSEEWSATTDKLKAMQREWTENSRFGTQVAEAQRLWKRFRSACDKFFERKSELHKQRNADRKENLQAKYDVVDRLEALLDRRNDPSTADEVKALEQEWRSIGPVPNDEKDDVLNRYFGAMRILNGQGGQGGRRGNRREGGNKDRRGGGGNFRRGDRRDDRQREPKFSKVNLDKDLSKLSKDDLKDEQKNVKYGISKLEDELLQLETNFSFFSGDPSNPMVKHVQQQIDEVKAKISQYRDRVGEIKEEAKKPEDEQSDDSKSETPAEEGETKPEATAETPAEAPETTDVE